MCTFGYSQVYTCGYTLLYQVGIRGIIPERPVSLLLLTPFGLQAACKKHKNRFLSILFSRRRKKQKCSLILLPTGTLRIQQRKMPYKLWVARNAYVPWPVHIRKLGPPVNDTRIRNNVLFYRHVASRRWEKYSETEHTLQSAF